MADSLEHLERRINELRAALRLAATSGDRQRARALRADLRQAEHAWEEALADVEERAPSDEAHAVPARAVGPLVPLREQVHQVLTLLTVPTAPRLIIEVHAAFFGGEILGARLTSLRRDEERSFMSAPFARPYYICAALTADLLGPARALLAVSTWPMRCRVVGPLSARVGFLTAAIKVAERLQRLPDHGPAATRLLWRFAANIPGAVSGSNAAKPTTVVRAAQAELDVHREEDRALREESAERARRQLTDSQCLFGAPLGTVRRTGTA